MAIGKRFVVVGAGVAGLVAAHRLQSSGHSVVVLESSADVGGRTRTARLGPDHLLDTGAAWLASFYNVARGFADGLPMLDRDVAGTPRLAIMAGGRVERIVPAPFSAMHLAGSGLLPVRERVRLARWAGESLLRGTCVGPRPGLRQPGDLIDARSEAERRVGPHAVEYVLRPAFETMVFSGLEELSAAFVSGWLAAAAAAGYTVPADGMDAPWRRLADQLDVRTGTRVSRVARIPSGVRVSAGDADHQVNAEFDAAVVAVPAPVAATLLDPGPEVPPWLSSVRYSTHVFGYAARQVTDPPPASDIHPAGPGSHRIGSVQLLPGGDGRVPPGWQAAVVSASGGYSAGLVDRREDDEVLADLWRAGRVLEPDLFDVAECPVTHVVRWRDAVPVFGPGHLTRLAGWEPTGPIALAGDWSVYPCVEGAARSGLRAADALLTG